MRLNCWTFMIILGLAGCASVPKMNYYTLDMRPSAPQGPEDGIAIDRLRITDSLAGRNILIHASPTQIEYYAVDQWAAGLDDLLREKLETEFHAGTAPMKYVASGDLLDFGQEDTPEGPQARLRATFEYRTRAMGRYDEPLLRKTYEFRLPAKSADAASVVQALSRCAEELAAAMAADVRALHAP